MSHKSNDTYNEQQEEIRQEQEYMEKKYCNCSDSHLVVPGDIDTAFCRYCQKPPVNKLNK